jgi:hypothetical protein
MVIVIYIFIYIETPLYLFVDLPCDADIQVFTDEILTFLDILSNEPTADIKMMADKIVRNFKDLVRFGLQQAFILVINFIYI